MNTTESGVSIASVGTLNQSEFSYDEINTSQSSAGSALSEIETATSNLTTKKQKTAAKKMTKKQRKLELKKEKQRRKNKITKGDFYNKSLEFKIWLSEKKKLTYEDVPLVKSKELFKKFVKKWNKKKLPVHYYRGADTLWAIGSPGTQSMWAMPGNVDVTPSSLPEEALEQQYSRLEKDAGFSTFGKKDGNRALKELQRMMQDEKAETSHVSHQLPKPEEQPTLRHRHSRIVKAKQLDAPPSLANLFKPLPPSRGLVTHTRPSPAQPKMGLQGRACAHKRSQSHGGSISSSLSASSENLEEPCGVGRISDESLSKRQKLNKQDSYTEEIESAGKAVFEILESARKQHLHTVVSPVKSRPSGPIIPLAPHKPLPPDSAYTNENKGTGHPLSFVPGKTT